MGKGISKKLKDAVWHRDRGLCFYCGRFLTKGHPERTLDHVIPKSKGGANRMWNLVISCKACNSEKEDQDPTQEQLVVILSRKAWSESYVALGQAIGRAMDAGEAHEALILKGMQAAIFRAMHNLAEKN